MQKWIIFVVLKVVETLTILLAPFCAGLFLHWTGFYSPSPMGGMWLVWLSGIPFFMMAIVAILLCVASYAILTKVVPEIIDMNMRLAEKLSKWNW